MNNNINNNEFEFLNNQKSNNKSNKTGFLKIIDLFIILLSIFCNIFIIVLESFCKFIEFVCWGDVAYTAYKTTKKKKKKKWF